jgi:hypothetical protein
VSACTLGLRRAPLWASQTMPLMASSPQHVALSPHGTNVAAHRGVAHQSMLQTMPIMPNAPQHSSVVAAVSQLVKQEATPQPGPLIPTPCIQRAACDVQHATGIMHLPTCNARERSKTAPWPPVGTLLVRLFLACARAAHTCCAHVPRVKGLVAYSVGFRAYACAASAGGLR